MIAIISVGFTTTLLICKGLPVAVQQVSLQDTGESLWRWWQSSYHFCSHSQVSFGLENNSKFVL